jgi:hypothetical protein
MSQSETTNNLAPTPRCDARTHGESHRVTAASPLGQSHRSHRLLTASGLPPRTDVIRSARLVRFVPEADLTTPSSRASVRDRTPSDKSYCLSERDERYARHVAARALRPRSKQAEIQAARNIHELSERRPEFVERRELGPPGPAQFPI